MNKKKPTKLFFLKKQMSNNEIKKEKKRMHPLTFQTSDQGP